MEKLAHPNAVRSANLFRLSALVYLISYWLMRKGATIFDGEVMLSTIIMLIASAFFVRRGYPWVRWVLLILLIPGILLTIITIPSLFKAGSTDVYIGLLQTIIQTAAVIILFIPYKPVAVPTEVIV